MAMEETLKKQVLLEIKDLRIEGYASTAWTSPCTAAR